MALSRPTRFYPDKSSGEYQSINGKKEILSSQITNVNTNFKMISSNSGVNPSKYISTPFSFVVKGTSKIDGIKITILNLSNNKIFESNKISPISVLYPVNYLGEDVVINAYIPLTNSSGAYYLNNDINSNYKWFVTIYWVENGITKTLTSSEIYFESRQDLVINSIDIDNGSVIYDFSVAQVNLTGIEHTFKANITPSVDTSPINYFNWKLYDIYNNMIYDTGEIHSQDIKFIYNGFLPYTYYLELKINNIYGNIVTKKFKIVCSSQYQLLNSKLTITNNFSDQSLHIEWENKSPNKNIVDELIAKGVIADNGDLVGFDLYRQKKNDTYLKYLFTFSANAYECYDYDVCNETEYNYFLYPIVKPDNQEIIGGYVSSDNFVKASFWGNILLVLAPNPNQEKGIYRVFKSFVWNVGLDTTSFKNNVNISVNNNFTQFPRIQKGKSNYMTYSLQGLIGYISCENSEYVDTQSMINDIRCLSNSDYLMVYKNSKGTIMKVAPISEVNFTSNEKLSNLLTSMGLEIAEIGRMDNISIVNRVSNSAWMFTTSGVQPINTLSINMIGYTIRAGEIITPSNELIE